MQARLPRPVPTLARAGLALALVAGVLAADGDAPNAPAHLESTPFVAGQPCTITLRSPDAGANAIVFYAAGPGSFVPASPLRPVVRTGLPRFKAFSGVIGANGKLAATAAVPPTFPVGAPIFLQGIVLRGPAQIRFGSEPLALAVGRPPVTFSDGLSQLDPETANHSGQDVDWADVNRDGWQDVLVANGDSDDRPLVLINHSGSLVEEGAARLPLAAQVPSICIEAGDVDLDGDLDLFLGAGPVAASPAPNVLLLNDGDGDFVVAASFPAGAGQAIDAEFGDVDGDRDLDVIVANQQDPLHGGETPDPVVLYLNQGGLQGGAVGTFAADSLFGSMPNNDVHGSGGDVSFGDLDDDGDLDLHVARAQGTTGAQNQLYVNDGLGAFVEVTGTALPVALDNSFEAELADFDGDGRLDVFVANSITSQPGVHLLRNLGPIGPGGTPVFADASASVPASFGPTTNVRISLDVGDVDQDGDPDVSVGIHELPAGPPPLTNGKTVLLINQGGNQGGTLGTFAVDAAFAPSRPMVGGDVAFGDLDLDGDLDLYVTNTGRLFVGDEEDELLINDF